MNERAKQLTATPSRNGQAPSNKPKQEKHHRKSSSAVAAPHRKNPAPLYLTQDPVDQCLDKYGIRTVNLRPNVDALTDPVTTKPIAAGPEYQAHLRDQQHQHLRRMIDRIVRKYPDRPLVMLVQPSLLSEQPQAGELVMMHEEIRRQAQVVADGTGRSVHVIELWGLLRDDEGNATVYCDTGSLRQWIDDVPAKLRSIPARLRRLLRQQALHRVSTVTARVAQDNWERGLTAAELLDSSDEPEYLIDGVLVKGQLLMLVGPVKSAKTSIAVDIIVSLATGTRLLNYPRFQTHGRHRVGLFSGEGGRSILRSVYRRVSKSKGFRDARGLSISWHIGLPQLSDLMQLATLGRIIREERLAVVIIDPLYLCLLSGDAPIDPSDMWKMGPLLARVRDTIVSAGATPILCHHSTKAARASREPPELEQTAWAGFGEFAEQWLQIGLRARYDDVLGAHRLWMCCGGRAGHFGTYAVDITEGSQGDPGGRNWKPKVLPASEEFARRATEAATKKLSKQQKEDRDRMPALIAALQRAGGRATQNELTRHQGISPEVAKRVLHLMEREGQVRPVMTTSTSGRGKGTTCQGWELTDDQNEDDEEENEAENE
jgi:hypothetical protein